MLQKHFRVFRLEPEHGYRIQPQDLNDLLGSLPQIRHTLVLNNSHNSSGVAYGRDELEAIAAICRKQNTLVLLLVLLPWLSTWLPSLL